METPLKGSYVTLMPDIAMQWCIEIEIVNVLATARYSKQLLL